MIKVSGFNVFPNEIENVVASYPKVMEVAAIGVPDAKSGEVIKMFIVKKDQSLTETGDPEILPGKSHQTTKFQSTWNSEKNCQKQMLARYCGGFSAKSRPRSWPPKGKCDLGFRNLRERPVILPDSQCPNIYAMMGFFEHQYLSYKKTHIKNLLAFAKADGHMHPKEEALLYKIGNRYGLKDRQIKQLVDTDEKFEVNVPDNHQRPNEFAIRSHPHGICG